MTSVHAVRYVVACAGALALGTGAFAQTAQTDRELYQSACAACHGSDAAGARP